MTNFTDFKTKSLRVEVHVSYEKIFSEMKDVPTSTIFGVKLTDPLGIHQPTGWSYSTN